MAGISHGADLGPTQDERTMATLAHGLQLIGSWIAPLVIFLIKRESRFVSFHALQALLLQIAYTILMVVTVVGGFVLMFATIALHAGEKAAPPAAVFMFFPLIWVIAFGGWIVNLVMAIVFCIKASQGEWAEYPILGPLARKMLKIGPGGVQLSAQA